MDGGNGLVWLLFFNNYSELAQLRSQSIGSLRAIQQDPILYLSTSLMVGGMMVFLWWIVAVNSPLSIDGIRPSGLPLGFWGFGVGFIGMALNFSTKR